MESESDAFTSRNVTESFVRTLNEALLKDPEFPRIMRTRLVTSFAMDKHSTIGTVYDQGTVFVSPLSILNGALRASGCDAIAVKVDTTSTGEVAIEFCRAT